jgi:uncharacterized membrane protein YphA (DoxX/SURF4 family)
VLDGIGTLARLGLAAVWITSGLLKVVDPAQTYVAVRAYDVLPRAAVGVVAGVLPWFELALGLLLLMGVGVRAVAVLSAGLLLLFIAGVGQAWARGLSIDCGCFGGVQEILRDVGFLALAGWLVVRPRTVLAVERSLVTSHSGSGGN